MQVLVELEVQMPHAGTLTPTAFAVAENLSEADWRRAGEILAREVNATGWWFGDWWNFGCHKWYGDRLAIAMSPDWRGPSFQACTHAGRVSRKFEVSRRRPGLSFSHHAVVAHLPNDQQDALLDRAEREGAGRRVVSQWARGLKDGSPPSKPTLDRDELRVRMQDLCKGKSAGTAERAMRTIVLDPATAQRVVNGELRIASGYEIAKAIAKQREEVDRNKRAAFTKALQSSLPVTTNVVHFADKQAEMEAFKADMGRNLVSAIDLLTAVAQCKVAPYLLKDCLSREDARRIGFEVHECRRFLKYVQDTWAHRDAEKVTQ